MVNNIVMVKIKQLTELPTDCIFYGMEWKTTWNEFTSPEKDHGVIPP